MWSNIIISFGLSKLILHLWLLSINIYTYNILDSVKKLLWIGTKNLLFRLTWHVGSQVQWFNFAYYEHQLLSWMMHYNLINTYYFEGCWFNSFFQLNCWCSVLLTWEIFLLDLWVEKIMDLFTKIGIMMKLMKARWKNSLNFG